MTKEEHDGVRRAVRVLRAQLGAGALAKALHADRKGLRRLLDGGSATPDLAFRVARLAGVGVDDVLASRFPGPDTCPHCGESVPT